MDQKTMPSPRLTPMNAADAPELQADFEAAKKRMGFLPNSVLIMARKPKMVKGFQALSASVWDPEGKVPVIYRLDLNDPRSFLVSQSFPINNRDVLYISNASLAELQKFLNILGAIIDPFATFQVITE